MVDAKTLIISFCITNALGMIMMLILWSQNRRRFAGILYWSSSYIALTMGTVAMLFHNNLPVLLAYTVANVLIGLSLFLFYFGVAKFIGESGSRWPSYLLLTVFVGVCGYNYLVQPSLIFQIISNAVTIIIVSLECIWLIMKRTPPPLRSITRNLVVIMFGFMLTGAVRIFFGVYAPPVGNNIFDAGVPEALLYLVNEILVLCLTYILILTINARLVLDLQIASAEKDELARGLKQLATTDTLTGIYNRQRMDNFLTVEAYRAQRYQRPLALIMADIDHFKDVNDTFGHDAGDLMLQELSLLLSQSTRETDFVGRWGGEEFLIISPETGLREALRLAERLRLQIMGHSFKNVESKTISLGVAEYQEGDTRETFLKRADDALYRAKERGRNRVEQ